MDYSVSIPNPEILLAAGFVVPRILSITSPYRIAIGDALNRCLGLKNPDDLWRIDRYAAEAMDDPSNSLRQCSSLPYDDVVLGPNIKNHHGFLAAPDLLEKLISDTGSKERSAADVLEGVDRVMESIGKNTGMRHMFLFLRQNSTEWPVAHARLKRITDFACDERIALHGFSVEPGDPWPELSDVCLATQGGSFTVTTVDALAGAVERCYSELVGRFEISYTLPSVGTTAAGGVLNISSDLGSGQTEFTLAAHAERSL